MMMFELPLLLDEVNGPDGDGAGGGGGGGGGGSGRRGGGIFLTPEAQIVLHAVSDTALGRDEIVALVAESLRHTAAAAAAAVTGAAPQPQPQQQIEGDVDRALAQLQEQGIVTTDGSARYKLTSMGARLAPMTVRRGGGGGGGGTDEEEGTDEEDASDEGDGDS